MQFLYSFYEYFQMVIVFKGFQTNWFDFRMALTKKMSFTKIPVHFWRLVLHTGKSTFEFLYELKHNVVIQQDLNLKKKTNLVAITTDNAPFKNMYI